MRIFMLLFLAYSALFALPKGFVYLSDEIKNIEIDARYYGENNFLGTRVDGYEVNRAILSLQATNALKKVQTELNSFGLGVKVFDAYRPQMAVAHFVRWAKDINDTKMKQAYYPDVDKKNLFKLGYIASKSSHTRGSTLDLTIIDLASKKELDMGSGFDFFGKISSPFYQKLSPKQRANRALLFGIMQKHGFAHYPEEWWHFTFKDEPFKETYFNFKVK